MIVIRLGGVLCCFDDQHDYHSLIIITNCLYSILYATMQNTLVLMIVIWVHYRMSALNLPQSHHTMMVVGIFFPCLFIQQFIQSFTEFVDI